MNRTRKVELLYLKAKGMDNGASAAENRELKKYRISYGEPSFYVTKANISAYVKAVDAGTIQGFSDWCQNNLRADRRRKGSSAESIQSNNRFFSMNAGMIGALPWAFCLYYASGGGINPLMSIIIGAVIAFFLCKLNRRAIFILCLVLPVVLAVIFGKMRGM